jgi:hypothetical protein
MEIHACMKYIQIKIDSFAHQKKQQGEETSHIIGENICKPYI